MFMVSNTLGGIVSMLAAAFIWIEMMSIPITTTTAIAMGIATSAAQSPLTAMVPTIVPRERLMNGILLCTMDQNLGMILDVSVGGMTIQFWGRGERHPRYRLRSRHRCHDGRRHPTAASNRVVTTYSL